MAHPPKLDNELRAFRLKAGWSQSELAMRSGLSRAEISAIETGRLVRREPYEICFPDSQAEDARLAAFANVVRSSRYRRLLGELPGYDTSSAGELRRIAVPRK
jgi:transcriptional regulator with XRE-family HTH domain